MSYICLRLLWDTHQNWIGVQAFNSGSAESTDEAIDMLPEQLSKKPYLAYLTWLLHFSQSPTTHALSPVNPAQAVYLALGSHECALAEGLILQSQGYKIACYPDTGLQETLDAQPWWDIYLLNAADLATGQLASQNLRNLDIAFLGVDSKASFEHCAQFDPKFMAGTFATEFRLSDHPDGSPAHVRLIRLLTLVADDASTEDIEKVFSQEPQLAFDLLRLVNSVAFRGGASVTTFRNAIVLLGRRQLQRWIQLLLYTQQFHEGLKQNPLLLLAAQRGHLLEMMCRILDSEDPDFSEYGFMVGIFSLLDVLFGAPLATLVKDLPLPKPVCNALLTGQGVLGSLLKLVQSLEQGNGELVASCAKSAGIDAAQLLSAQLETLAWLGELRGESHV